jgi:hypothetical protein
MKDEGTDAVLNFAQRRIEKAIGEDLKLVLTRAAAITMFETLNEIERQLRVNLVPVQGENRFKVLFEWREADEHGQS